MPDVSLIIPLSSVLGVTADCLLGAGTNEKEDEETLNKEISEITDGHWVKDYKGSAYRLICLSEQFLKKYPTNYGVKLRCADWICIYLHDAKVGKSYEIPKDEFDELWKKGYKMLCSVKNQDKDPTNLVLCLVIMVHYLNLKDEFDKATEIASELPEAHITKLDALMAIARAGGDNDRWTELSTLSALIKCHDSCWEMWSRARRISILGQIRKEEAIEAWHDALRMAREYDRVFGKNWPHKKADGTLLNYSHPKILIAETYFPLIVDNLALDRMDEALDLVEELTEIGEELYDELKDKRSLGLIDEKSFAEVFEEIKGFPLCCYNSVFDTDDNILTREERFIACKARLDALE